VRTAHAVPIDGQETSSARCARDVIAITKMRFFYRGTPPGGPRPWKPFARRAGTWATTPTGGWS